MLNKNYCLNKKEALRKMTTQTQHKVYSYDDLIQDICKDPAGIHNLGHGTTQGYNKM